MASTLFGLGSIAEAGGKAYVERRAYDLTRRQAESNIEHLRALERQAARQQTLSERTYESGLWDKVGETYIGGQRKLVFRNRRDGQLQIHDIPGLDPNSPAAKIEQLTNLPNSMPPGVREKLPADMSKLMDGPLLYEMLGLPQPYERFTVNDPKFGPIVVERNRYTKEVKPVVGPDGKPLAAVIPGYVPSAVNPFTGELQVGGPVSKVVPPRAGTGSLVPPPGVAAQLPNVVGRGQAAAGTAPSRVGAPRTGGGGMQAALPFDPAILARAIQQDPHKWSLVRDNQVTEILRAAEAQGFKLPSKESYTAYKESADLAMDADIRLRQMYEQAQHNDPAAHQALLFNHIAMTVGDVKGGRVTEDIIEKHREARDLPSNVMQWIDMRATGRALTPEQLKNFIRLAEGVRLSLWMKAARKGADVGVQNLPTPDPELPAMPIVDRVLQGGQAQSGQGAKLASPADVQAFSKQSGISYGEALKIFQAKGYTIK